MRSQPESVDLIHEHFPDLVVTQVRVLPHIGWGGESDALLINDRYIFLFPRWPETARALAVDVCLLPKLAPRVALPIPSFQYIAYDQAAGMPLLVGYPAIPGQPLTPTLFQAIATDELTLERTASQLGAFLSGLHTCPLELARQCGVPWPPLSPVELVTRQYERLRSQVYPLLLADECHFLDRLFTSSLADLKHVEWSPTLCHGDLTSDHILTDSSGAGHITGIIDFGDVCVGDPAGDFVWRLEYGDDFFRRVLASYHAPVGDLEAFARRVTYRARLMPTVEIAYGLETNNAAYVEEGRRSLRAHMNRD